MTEIERYVRDRVSINKFSLHNGILLESVERDCAVFSMEIQPESTNDHGTLHGGAVYTLADMATGCAACSDGRRYVTQNGSLNFVSAQTEGTVKAVAKVQHRGRTIAVVHVDVVGTSYKLLATGEFSFFCIEYRK